MKTNIAACCGVDKTKFDAKVIDVEPIRPLFTDDQFKQILGKDIFNATLDNEVKRKLTTLADLSKEEKKHVALLAASKGVREILQIPDFKSIITLDDKDNGGADCFNRNALHYAAYNGQVETIRYLLEDLAMDYTQFVDTWNHNAFHYACESGNLQLVEFFVNKMKEEKVEFEHDDEDIDNNEGIVVTDSYSAKNSKKGSIKLALRKHITGEDVFVALVLAARKGNIKIVLRLLNEYKEMLRRIENGVGTHCNSLLHLLGRSISAGDLRKLEECGLELDFTAANTNGIKVFEPIPPDTIKEFLDLSVSCVQENIDKNITESYCIENPFLHRNHSVHSNLDLITLLEFSKSKIHRHLIFHPVFFGIYSIKWQYVRKYYYMLLVLFLLFATVISTVTVVLITGATLTYNTSASTDVNSSQDLLHVQVWQILFVTLLFILTLLEIISVIFTRTIINLIRYLTWSTCDIAIIVVLSTCSPIFIQQNSFFIILIPWLMCVKHIGHHHLLSRYYSNFIEIAKTCFKIFCVFGPLIVAFTLVFHIMMLSKEPYVEQTVFQYLHTASLKTVTMMIGDLTIDDFSHKFTDIQWSVTFTIFTTIIAFILYNMTNALAVSDTEKLNTEADVFKIVSITKQILLFQNILNNLALICNMKYIFVPNIKDFTVNCNDYQWKLEKYSYENSTFKSNESSTSLDYVDVRDSPVILQDSCSFVIDFKFGNQIRAIVEHKG